MQRREEEEERREGSTLARELLGDPGPTDSLGGPGPDRQRGLCGDWWPRLPARESKNPAKPPPTALCNWKTMSHVGSSSQGAWAAIYLVGDHSPLGRVVLRVYGRKGK